MPTQCSKISLEKLNNQVYDSYYSDDIEDGWEDKDKRFNFYYLFQIAPTFEKSSLLDVGCGAQQELNKEGVELISVPETIYPDVFYYEKNPYLVPTMTLEIPDGGCFIE